MIRTLKEAQALSKPIRFAPDNEAKYFMDFSFWKGLPSDRDFYDVGVAKGDSRELVALGYGLKEDYGNGSIFIPSKYIPT